MRASVMVLPVLVLAQLPGQPLAPWGANHHPTDVPKHHVEQAAAGRHAYTVRQGGTMDGTNCRSPLGVGMTDGPAVQQTWESNRAVRLENVGETDVVNPWLSNGRNSFRALGKIVASAVELGMTDREKAFALWFQEVRHRYHWAGDNAELGDPVKVFNVYGHNTCGNDSICLAGLWRRAGLKATPARVVGHCVSQAFFDGRWNLFDGDMHSLYPVRGVEPGRPTSGGVSPESGAETAFPVTHGRRWSCRQGKPDSIRLGRPISRRPVTPSCRRFGGNRHTTSGPGGARGWSAGWQRRPRGDCGP
jgi:hypothetical protein